MKMMKGMDWCGARKNDEPQNLLSTIKNRKKQFIMALSFAIGFFSIKAIE